MGLHTGDKLSIEKISNPILYSTITAVAYSIGVKYYANRHYMWCTPYFGSDFTSPHFTVPPSSSPLEIYNIIKNEIDGADGHGTKIKLNRMGIRRGADVMQKREMIDSDEVREIYAIADNAPPHQFRPMLCIIPRVAAIPYYKKVDILDRANPLSYEYIVADVPQSEFDIIRIG
ncbi:hypothetical protein [Hyphomonas sp.]|uniref:hypothetical protein n=1 Tax=Hyphomonas sp. TaxID=87 RepID=UPI00300112FA